MMYMYQEPGLPLQAGLRLPRTIANTCPGKYMPIHAKRIMFEMGLSGESATRYLIPTGGRADVRTKEMVVGRTDGRPVERTDGRSASRADGGQTNDDLFKTNYAKRLRQPYGNLIYGLDLKHLYVGIRACGRTDGRTDGRSDMLYSRRSDGRTDGRTDERTTGQRHESSISPYHCNIYDP